MVDIKARNIFSRALDRFAKGVITNFEYEREFESQLPEDTNDLAILRIRDRIACLYSDLNEHKLDGGRSPTTEVRGVIDRCVLFLHTDLEYEWPERNTLVDQFLQALTLGRYKLGIVRGAGDMRVWPFLREMDYIKASEHVST